MEQLSRSLEDKSCSVKQAVIEALGELGDQRGMKPLLIMLKDQDLAVRKATVDALDRIAVNDPQIVAPLVKMLGDKDRLVRGNVSWP